MTNNKQLKKNEPNESSPNVNKIDEKGEKKVTSDKIAEKKKKVSPKKSSALVAASLGRSAVDAVQPNSGQDVKGTSDLANTGPFVSYEDK